MDQQLEDLRTIAKESFEDAMFSEGKVERLEERVDKLENAVAWLTSFIAKRLALDYKEIHHEDGILDW